MKLYSLLCNGCRLLILCVFAFTCLGQSPAGSFDPAKPLDKFIIHHWTTEEGLPVNTLIDMLQTRDGFLWISSYNGLARFDGMKFRVFNKENTGAFQSNAISRLLETSKGTLLLATEGGGLLKYENDTFKTIIPKEKIASIQALCEDRQGQLWIGTHGHGVFVLKDNVLSPFTVHRRLAQVSVINIMQDESGTIWFCTEGQGLVGYDDGKIFSYTTAQGLPDNKIHGVHQDQNRDLWVGLPVGAARIHKGKVEVIEALKGYPIRKILHDAEGNIWMASQKGLIRYQPATKKLEILNSTNSFLPHSDLRDLVIDLEGNLWITSYRSGLIQLQNGKFVNYTMNDGLASAVANAICEYEKGKYLIGTDAGVINTIENGKVGLFPLRTQLANDKRIKHLRKDRKGNLWVSTYDGLVKISPQGQETHYTIGKGFPSHQVRFVYETRDGEIWVGTRDSGLLRLTEDGRFEVFNKSRGMFSNFIMSMSEDQAGNFFVGTNDGGLNIIDKNGKITGYSLESGLASNLVFNIHIDKNNVAWVTTNNGISNFSNGNFINIGANNGLPDETIFDMLEDNVGNVWMSCSKGIIKTRKQELEHFVSGKISMVSSTLYDKQDGMHRSECTGASMMLKAGDGSLWFPTLGGVVTIDPPRVEINQVPPPVYIESFTVDYNAVKLTGKPLSIAPGAHRFVVDYTALSFKAPAKIRFKFRLRGFEEEWLQPTSDRRATYTNLTPGTYTFEVIACNNDGTWSTKGAELVFTVEPHFYQTIWFIILTITLIIGGLFGAYRYQVARVKRRNAELEEMVELRTAEIQRKSDEILAKNAELEQQQEEILAQRELIEEKNYKLEEAVAEIQRKNNNITGSIQYARRIQQAMLPSLSEVREALPEAFIYYKPRDIISGDFYWFANMKKLHNSNRAVLAIADCTGHGVPGAFMSMAGDAYLNQIVKVQAVSLPDQILHLLHNRISEALHQQETNNRDGMDVAICSIDLENRILEYAGAKTSLLYIQQDENGQWEINEIKGDKIPVGGHWGRANEERLFTTHRMQLPHNKSTAFYVFSDGYIDQFGTNGKKFTRRKLKELLLSIHLEAPEKQQQMLDQAILNWMGDHKQIDDIMVIGFKI